MERHTNRFNKRKKRRPLGAMDLAQKITDRRVARLDSRSSWIHQALLLHKQVDLLVFTDSVLLSQALRLCTKLVSFEHHETQEIRRRQPMHDRWHNRRHLGVPDSVELLVVLPLEPRLQLSTLFAL